jgi:hypothetical protein
MPHRLVVTMAMDRNILRPAHASDRASLNPTRTCTTTLESHTAQVITTTIIIHPNVVIITRSVAIKTFAAGMILTKEIAYQKWMSTVSARCPLNLVVGGRRMQTVSTTEKVGGTEIESEIAIEDPRTRTATETEARTPTPTGGMAAVKDALVVETEGLEEARHSTEQVTRQQIMPMVLMVIGL